MKENIIKNRSLEFAVRIVNLYKYLYDEKKDYVISKQILRSGTNIGTNVRKAEHTQNPDDFIHKKLYYIKGNKRNRILA
jgi:four helix bundle protein